MAKTVNVSLFLINYGPRQKDEWGSSYIARSGQFHALATSPPGQERSSPRTGLDKERNEILPLLRLELRSLGRTPRSQPLYRLCYPGTTCWVQDTNKYMGMFPDITQ
jgi:hypothetical protein